MCSSTLAVLDSVDIGSVAANQFIRWGNNVSSATLEAENFKAYSSSSQRYLPMDIVLQALVRFISIYLALLIIRVLLSWFPNLDWSNPALSALSQITDPYLNLFRSIIPPLGGIDFSAILAFVVLNFVQYALSSAIIALSSSGYTAYSAF